MISIRTDGPSLGAQRSLSGLINQQNKLFEKLATGQRVNRAADDAAALAISEQLRAEIASTNAAEQNVLAGVNLADVAGGAASSISDSLGKLKELAVQASNGTLSAEDQAALDAEFQQVVSGIDQIANTTEFNGQSLLTGGTQTIQAGTDGASTDSVALTAGNLTSAGLGLGGVSVSSTANAQSALTAIESAINNASAGQAQIGAFSNRLDTSISNLRTSRENAIGADSVLRDADIAQLASERTKNNILLQANVAIQAQANLNTGRVQKLL